MLAALVLVSCVALGFGLLRLARAELNAAERLVAGPVLGIVCGFWGIYLAASVAGAITWAVLLGSAVVYLAGAALTLLVPGPASWRPDPWFGWLAAGVGAVMSAMNVAWVLGRDGAGNVVAAEHVWADVPFHAALANSFAFAQNFPPTYPMALGEPLGYPFVVNIVSAALMAGGWSLRWSFVVPGVVVQVAVILGAAAIAHRLTGSRRAAVIAAGLLLCLGNLGWLAVPSDVAAAGGLWAWIRELPWSYTGDALGEPGRQRLGTGMYLGNPTFMLLLPRRSAALGFAAGLVILMLLDALRRRPGVGVAVLTGLTIGLLPRVHGHTLVAMAVFALVWAVAIPAVKGTPAGKGWVRDWREAAPLWLLAGGVALVVGAPQLVAMAGQSADFVSWWPGWTGEPHEAARQTLEATGGARLGAAVTAFATWGWFWLLNAGVLGIVAIVALASARRRIQLWYLPFGLLWALGNLVRTQPWEWDNSVWFHWWQVGTVVLVAGLLAGLLRRDALVRAAVGVLLIATVVAGGLLSLGFAAQNRHHLWTPEEVAFASQVRGHTPPEAAILTSNGHTHPVIALSGRQTYLGFTGWLFTHGLPWHTFEERMRRMFEGDLQLMADLGIDYVVIGPWERALQDVDLAEVFEDPAAFETVHEADIGGQSWRLLRLLEGPG